jgi:hypothetical protein
METSQPEGGLSLSLSLVSNTIMLGEPIILRYDIVVRGEEELWVYLGQEQSAWASLSLVDEAGQPAPERPDPRRPQGGLQRMKQVRVAPGRAYQASLIVTQWLTVPHTGRYELHVKARLPYMPRTPLDVPGERAEGYPVHSWHQKTKTVFVQEQSFTLTVTEPEEARLRGIAEGLRQDAMMGPDHDQRIAALRALLAMPEQYALLSWEALASDPGFRHKEDLMRELAHVMSPAAADLLAQMWNPGYGPLLITTLATVLLDNMYRAGDESLKRHIEGILARYGKKVSDYELRIIG